MYILIILLHGHLLFCDRCLRRCIARNNKIYAANALPKKLTIMVSAGVEMVADGFLVVAGMGISEGMTLL